MSLETLRLLLGPGRLKIYLGYAVGVGKTHRALLELRELKRRGVDVAIGWLEPKDRPLLGALAEGLPLIPPRREGPYEVMDLEAILARRPSTLLVDELARRNPPGYPRRHEEVARLLEAGISVLTTLNAYHLESLAGAAEAYLGHRVEERVPDSLLEEADEVVLVDLPPEDLRARLAEGKVYPPEKVAEALKGFFTLENLKALRELALAEVSGLAAGRPAPLGPVLVYGDSERVFLRAARVAERFGEPLYLLTETAPEGLLKLAHAHRAKVKVLGPLRPPERLLALEAYARRLAPGLVVLPLGPLAEEATGRLPQTLLLVPPEGISPGPQAKRLGFPLCRSLPAP